MYDAMPAGEPQDKSKGLIRNRTAVDFGLDSVPFYAEDERARELMPSSQPEEAYLWAEKLMEKGLTGDDIQFLVDVLSPVPGARPTPGEILESGYLKKL